MIEVVFNDSVKGSSKQQKIVNRLGFGKAMHHIQPVDMPFFVML